VVEERWDGDRLTRPAPLPEHALPTRAEPAMPDGFYTDWDPVAARQLRDRVGAAEYVRLVAAGYRPTRQGDAA
jgi:hypothetical protein